jgi:CRP-like cAMP-binding protein
MFDPSGVLAAHGPVLIIEDEPFIGEELRAAFRMCGAATLGPFPDAETAKRSTDLRRARLAVINIASKQESAFRLTATLMRDGTPTVLTAGADIEIPPELAGAKVVTKPFEAQAFAKWLLRGEASISRPSGFANKLLNRFPTDQLSELRQHASLVQLRRGMALGRAGVRSEHIWFIESGLCILSLRCGGVDVGMIGREGAIGLESCLVSNNALCAPMHCVVEAPGKAVRISAIAMRLMAQSGSTREVLVAYLHSLHAQTASTLESATSLCIRARVSRWLLMASDRIGPAIPVTHDSLAAYLGVRRAGVTEALQDIGAANVIERKRGSILIRDRDALEARVRGVDAARRPYFESPAPAG